MLICTRLALYSVGALDLTVNVMDLNQFLAQNQGF